MPILNHWSARIDLDPLLWMANTFSDPEEFWASGARDLNQLTEIVAASLPHEARVLDLGCGIGRLIGPALARGWHVVGLDGAASALSIAKTRYQDSPALSLIHSALPSIPAQLGKFDLILSLATLPHLPPESFIATLLSIPKILHAQGRAVLHLYIGTQNLFSSDDDYSIRSYELERVRKTFQRLGLRIDAERKLDLPFNAKDEILGRYPLLFDLSLSHQGHVTAAELLDVLVNRETPPIYQTGSEDAFRVLATQINRLIGQRDFKSLSRYLVFGRKFHPEREEEWQRLEVGLRTASKTVLR